VKHLLCLALVSCGETAVNPLDTDPGSPDTDAGPDSDTDPGDSDLDPERCEPVETPGGPVADPVECRGSTRLSEPVLKWEAEVGPGIGALSSTLVAPWTDTDGNGTVDDLDVPHVFLPVNQELTLVFRGDTGALVDTLPVNPSAIGDLLGDPGPEVWGETPASEGVLGVKVCDPSGCSRWAPPSDPRFWSGHGGAVTDGDRDGVPHFYDGWGNQFNPATSAWQSPTPKSERSSGPAIVHGLFGDRHAHQVMADRILAPDGTTTCNLDTTTPLTRAAIELRGSVHLVGVQLLAVGLPCRPTDYEHPEDLTVALPGAGAIADFDGDGVPELGQAVAARGGRPSAVRVLNLDGSVVWERSGLPNGWGDWETTAADLDGDGVYELLGPGPYVYHGATGDTLLTFEAPARKDYGMPAALIAVDVDLDGHMEVIVPDLNRVRVYGGKEGWADGPTIWNQWSFTGTNIYPDGTVPRDPIEPWEMHNTFRASAGQAELRGKGSDLVARFVAVCEKECDRDRMRVAVQLGNGGTAPILRPVVMELFGVRGGERDLLASWTYPGVEAATWLAGEDVQVDVTTPFDDLQVEVRSTGWRHQQCDAGNDVVAWGRAVCR
jgi:hypothetical protein